MNTEYLQTQLVDAVKLKGNILSHKKIGLSSVSPENLSVDWHRIK